MNSTNKWQPLIYGVLIALGIFIGIWLRPAGSIRSMLTGNSKFGEVLNLIQQAYVDTVNMDELEEKTLNELLTNLDPHSVYIPAADLQQANEQLEGNFEGIGVEFNILNDTITVVAAIPGGPSAELGIQSGDRIIQVDTQRVAGVGITQDEVPKLLRGEKGTKVKVQIYRPEARKTISYTIIRNTIPIYSVDASMMLDDQTGYIRVSRFAANTHEEFSKALNQLKLQGLQHLVLDLRGNPGGYLSAATEICDELLDDDKMIVYTSGRTQPKSEYRASKKGILEKGKVVVLIDEQSASASEIVSGAVQDWDRGVIVGRRSFGKGLVQEPFTLKDGSSIRLTIARYYTPSGRCIQKPYDEGYDAYEEELYHRFEDGETADSSKVKVIDSTIYRTARGRIVYSRGGIMPDVFVPNDTSFLTSYLSEIRIAGLLNKFTLTYFESHKKELHAYANVQAFVTRFNADLVTPFVQFATAEGIRGTPAEISRTTPYLKRHLKALLARQLWREAGFFSVLNASDPFIKRSLQAIKEYDQLLR